VYKVLEAIGLPVMEEREVHPGITAKVPTGEVVRKYPGDTITKQEWSDAGQTDDDAKRLLKEKAMEEA
jgi:hypothetical protein